MASIGVAIIGTGQIALQNHLPGLRLMRSHARLVALCDSDPATLERAARDSGTTNTFSDYQKALAHPDVNAVIIATPNFLHPRIVLEAANLGKHVLCEKPLALDSVTATQMYRIAQSLGVCHMTAFTYRFVPAMRWMKHLLDSGAIGRPFHFRARRFQDWADRPLGWRQVKKLAGNGEIGDMLSHRIDYAHVLVGRIKRLVADFRNFVPTRGGQPSDVDDWVAMLCDFENGDITGVLESTKLATGRGEGLRGADDVELNGAEGTILYSTQKPLELRIGKRNGADLETVAVPKEFRVFPGSPRDPDEGDPLVTFRYDQTVEFINGIVEQRSCIPSLFDGAMVQAVMDTAATSFATRLWVDVRYPPP